MPAPEPTRRTVLGAAGAGALWLAAGVPAPAASTPPPTAVVGPEQHPGLRYWYPVRATRASCAPTSASTAARRPG